MSDAVSIQREYYRKTAERYDDMHVKTDEEHEFALAFMLSMVGYLGVRSVLDLGSGTGRAILATKAAYPHVTVLGIEPSTDLRKIGYAKGLAESELTDGDAQQMAQGDGAFDLVCAYGALHHIPSPRKAVSEMLRVASKAIFISDSNNFGQGTAMMRGVKQAARALGAWKFLDFVKTGGKGYMITEGDGLAYSYSVFSDYDQISKACRSVHLLNTKPSGINPYRSASHVALLGLK